ncbi:MAG: tRNA isopentenyl-2-thiomethyl-A-37 hydroxylase MiaE [Polyangiales bacterium]
MLNLLEPTPASWAREAEKNLSQLLSDHAHCELKAAQSALGLVARFGGEAPELVKPLTSLAKEETEHFNAVYARLQSGDLPKPPIDDYVRALQLSAKQDRGSAPILLDRLLVCALIEARSCERFSVLAEHLEDAELREFYSELMASEARHYRLFCFLAEQRYGVSVTRERLKTLANREAAIASRLPLGPTVHG